MRISLFPSIAMILCAWTALLCAGCGPTAPSTDSAPPPEPAGRAAETEDGPPVDGDWLIARLPAEMEHLNPFTSQDAYSSSINSFIFDTLLDMDNQTLELIPKLAQSWEISGDRLCYTFRMRQDARFTDGTPVTAHDVKFSFDAVMNPAVNAPHLRNYFQDIISCETLDDHTVQFVSNKPYFRHLLMLGGLEVIPKHIYSEGDFNNHPRNRDPVGSGPYVLESWTTGRQVVLTRNDEYWGEKPHILKRIYKIITNDEAAFQVLSRGEMDTMDIRPEIWVNRTDAPNFTARFNKFEYFSGGYSYIGWNMRRPQFTDKRVRQALTMLLDRETIRDTVYHGLAEIVTGAGFINDPEYNAAIQPWPFDPATARRQLDEAGWTDSDNDGVRDKDGTPFRFELLLPNDRPEYEIIATVYQEELKRAGIAMTIRQLEWATFLQSIQEQNFDASVLAWTTPPYFDPYQVWHSSQAVPGGSNAVGFVHEEADRLMEEARTEFDRDKRIQHYHRFHAILHEEQPYTFLFCRKSLVAADKRFRNTIVYPRGMDSKEWWVPTALQRYR